MTLRRLCCLGLALAALLPVRLSAQSPTATAARERCDLDGYRAHLRQLQAVVAGCSAKATVANCSPVLVGPDNEVSLGNETRFVGYAWLRNALAIAASNNQGQIPQAREGLREASERLAQDLELHAAKPVGDLAACHRRLAAILATPEFAAVKQTSWLDRARDALIQWLDARLLSLAAFGARSVWIARILVGVCLLLACGVLALWLNRQVRRQRAAPAPAYARSSDPAPTRESGLAAPRRLASGGRWREAVHCVYWAAISRLESKGLWPADQARTPREYLALVAPQNAKRAGLGRLTNDFERIWYGGSPAGESEFQRACALFEELVS